MAKVLRKSEQEALENLLRRFNRKVAQSGVLSIAKKKQFHEQAPNRRAVREAAIRKNRKRDERMRRIYLGH